MLCYSSAGPRLPGEEGESGGRPWWGIFFSDCKSDTLASFLVMQRCFGEAGATEKIVQTVLKFGNDAQVRTWAFKAIVSLAAGEDIDPAVLKACSSLKVMLKLLRDFT